MTIINAKKENTVIISEAEYNGLLETVHLIYVSKIKERFEKDYRIKILKQAIKNKKKKRQ